MTHDVRLNMSGKRERHLGDFDSIKLNDSETLVTRRQKANNDLHEIKIGNTFKGLK